MINPNSFYQPRKQIRSLEIEKLKLSNFVLDDSGKRPVSISVVIPTFNKNDKEYNRAVLNVISACGRLIDEGVIDEVVIAEGSRTKKGEIDREFIEFLLSIAVKYSKTFEREVEFIRSLPAGKMKSLQSRYNFSFRILNQIDPELHEIYLEHEILSEEEIEYLKSGKGANMWFSVPVTYGDIVCFVDSDAISFRKHYIKGLCLPILKGWKSSIKDGEQSSVVFTKASYIRQHKTRRGFKIGGRLSRLFGIPMFNLLAKHGIFNGLENITYPFSGEFAITRNTLNKLQFSNGYDIEISILCQLWKNVGIKKIREYNVGFFRHLPGSEEHVDKMLEEISMALFYWIRRYGFMDKIDNIDALLEEYERVAIDTLEIYSKIAQKMPSRVRYDERDMEEDRKRIKRYKQIIKRGYELSKTHEPKLLKPWESIKSYLNSKRGYSYQNLKSTLQNRVNKFTSDMILSYIRVYVDRSNEIISKFTE